MGRVNLRLAERLIEEGRPVVSLTGSLTADWQFDDDGYAYVVRSYGVDVAKVERKHIKDSEGNLVRTAEGKPKYDLTLWITPQKYSVTTSRHTNLASRALRVQLMKEVANG